LSAKSLVQRFGSLGRFERLTEKAGVTGVPIRTPGELVKELIGWMQPLSSNAISQLAQRGIQASHKLYIYENPPIQEGDIFKQNGKAYLVTSLPMDQGGVNSLWKVLIRERA